MSLAARRRFASVVLDVDSTLCGIEGIDWLAHERGDAVAASVAAATDRAMRGEIALEGVYASRLLAVKPNREDVRALSAAYMASLAAGAREVIESWRASGIRVDLISGGIRNAILPVATELGLSPDSVHAVGITFDDGGEFADFERGSPLTTAVGKREVVTALALPRPAIAAGDGSTDLAMRAALDAFAAFTGFVSRDVVVREADFVVGSFQELNQIVMGI